MINGSRETAGPPRARVWFGVSRGRRVVGHLPARDPQDLARSELIPGQRVELADLLYHHPRILVRLGALGDRPQALTSQDRNPDEVARGPRRLRPCGPGALAGPARLCSRWRFALLPSRTRSPPRSNSLSMVHPFDRIKVRSNTYDISEVCHSRDTSNRCLAFRGKTTNLVSVSDT